MLLPEPANKVRWSDGTMTWTAGKAGVSGPLAPDAIAGNARGTQYTQVSLDAATTRVPASPPSGFWDLTWRLRGHHVLDADGAWATLPAGQAVPAGQYVDSDGLLYHDVGWDNPMGFACTVSNQVQLHHDPASNVFSGWFTDDSTVTLTWPTDAIQVSTRPFSSDGPSYFGYGNYEISASLNMDLGAFMGAGEGDRYVPLTWGGTVGLIGGQSSYVGSVIIATDWTVAAVADPVQSGGPGAGTNAQVDFAFAAPPGWEKQVGAAGLGALSQPFSYTSSHDGFSRVYQVGVPAPGGLVSVGNLTDTDGPLPVPAPGAAPVVTELRFTCGFNQPFGGDTTDEYRGGTFQLMDDGPQSVFLTVQAPPATPPPPPASLSVDRTVLVPFLWCDPVSGRLYAVLGAASYRAGYGQSTDSSGRASLTLASYDHFVSHAAYLHTSLATGTRCPFARGSDVGLSLQAGIVTLPDALLALPQQGLVRVGVRSYDPARWQQGLLSATAWRESRDLGLSWQDGPSRTVGAPVGGPPACRAVLTGSSRGRHAAATDATAPPPMAGAEEAGATGWAPSGGLLASVRRFPGYGGPPAGEAGPWPADPSGLGDAPLVTRDSGLNALAALDPALGAVLPAADVPGYPWAGSWAGNPPESLAIFGACAVAPGVVSYDLTSVAAGGAVPVVSPAGGLAWARGPQGDAEGFVLCPTVMRLPLLRASYTPTGANAAEEGFKEWTDAQTATTGPAWGHTSGVVLAPVTSGGVLWGDKTPVRAGAAAVTGSAETVRIAACRDRAGALWLLFCADGVATLHRSDDALAWDAVGTSTDLGQTFTAIE